MLIAMNSDGIFEASQRYQRMDKHGKLVQDRHIRGIGETPWVAFDDWVEKAIALEDGDE